MLSFLILGLVNLVLGSQMLILEDGDPQNFVTEHLFRTEDNTAAFYFTGPAICVRKFDVLTSAADNAEVVISRIGGVFEGEYQWTKIGSGAVKNGRVQIDIEELCVSSWKVSVEGAESKVIDVSVDATRHHTDISKRADVPCDFDAGAPFPADCRVQTNGPRCLETGFCGCIDSNDCYNNNDYPQCVNGYCMYCHNGNIRGGPTDYTNVQDHQWCTARFPGREADRVESEKVAPTDFWREYCDRADETVGACLPCNNMLVYSDPVSGANHPHLARWTREGIETAIHPGLSGSIFCGLKSNGATPICVHSRLWQATHPNGVWADDATGLASRGKCKPCDSDSECAMVDSTKPLCYDGQCHRCTVDFGQTGVAPCRQDNPNCVDGVCTKIATCQDNNECAAGENCMNNNRCRACTNNADCVQNDGGAKNGQPICNNGVCVDCSSNAQCSQPGTGGANCQANGKCLNCGNQVVGNTNCGTADGGEVIGQPICDPVSNTCIDACSDNNVCAQRGGDDAFVRGKNCQKDGTCKTCTSDATCGNLDGGNTPNQPTCDVPNGICHTPFRCGTNADCANGQNGGFNCQKDGSCENCAVSRTSSNCDTSDGGETPNQKNCDQATRRCVDACTSNAQCVGTQGANCMANGLCLSCLSDADCRTGNAWGGDMGAQGNCNVATGICESPCARNADCPAGTNCNKDGRCAACTSNQNCLDMDGGEIFPQPKCTNGRCESCTRNADCPASEPNCGANGQCYSCVAGAGQNPDVNCGARDGGEVAGQVNCDAALGICVNYCTHDSDCHDDCTPVCNLNTGCCVECNNNNDCPHANWKFGEAERTECSADHTCIRPNECHSDADCPSSRPACSVAQGKCVGCLFDDHCGSATPKCLTAEQRCVECLNDRHCDKDDEEGTCYDGYTCSGANAVTMSVFVALLAGLIRLF